MNQHVTYNDIPILINVGRELRKAVDNLIDSGYVLEAVSKVGVASTHIGYRYLTECIEILLTDDNPQDHIVLMDMLSETYAVKPSVIKRAMDVCCMSCRYELFKRYIFDREDRMNISEKAFVRLDLISKLGYFVSHCVDRAEQSITGKKDVTFCDSIFLA